MPTETLHCKYCGEIVLVETDNTGAIVPDPTAYMVVESVLVYHLSCYSHMLPPPTVTHS